MCLWLHHDRTFSLTCLAQFKINTQYKHLFIHIIVRYQFLFTLHQLEWSSLQTIIILKSCVGEEVSSKLFPSPFISHNISVTYISPGITGGYIPWITGRHSVALCLMDAVCAGIFGVLSLLGLIWRNFFETFLDSFQGIQEWERGSVVGELWLFSRSWLQSGQL